MSRWADAFAAYDEGGDTIDTSDKTPSPTGSGPNCVAYVHCVTPPEAPNFADSSASIAPHDLDERGALIEYGSDVPRQWAEGYAALCVMTPLAGFSPERWQRIIDGAGRFMDRWAAKAAECGWSDLDVFGADPARPDRRFDCMGLLMLLDRMEVVAVDCDGADLQSTGALLRYRRRPVPPHTKPLWGLAS